MNQTVETGRIRGTLRVPASKSHTIRALLIASLARGTSRIIRPLLSSDTCSCRDACRLLGAMIAEIEDPREGFVWEVTGTAGKIARTSGPVDVGNSGTTLYLAAGLAALGTSPVTFTGDDQIRSRPVGDLLNSLEDLGARVTRQNGNCAPFTVCGPLSGGKTTIACPTSQYLSSLLIAAPLADGNSAIHVSLLNEQPYVEMTLRWLADQMIMLDNEHFQDFFIPGGQKFMEFETSVPGDFSSATFFFCAAAITAGEVTVEGLDWEDSQGDKEVVNFLKAMGCSAVIRDNSITVSRRPDTPLKGTVLDLNATPDALPALAATACVARGETRIVNVPQARLKETDRIAVMAAELSKMGADIRETPDGLIIRGGKLSGAAVEGHGDHRVVMALAVAGLAAGGTTEITTAEAVDITFPGFFEILRDLRSPQEDS